MSDAPLWMPLLGSRLAIRMSALNEATAQMNHGQSLGKLADRGGLSLREALACVRRVPLREVESVTNAAALDELFNPRKGPVMNHGLDTDERVCFYEQEFYVLSNFSAFKLQWRGVTYMTLEHCYHAMKFAETDIGTLELIHYAPSAHRAFEIAQANKHKRRKDWDDVKVPLMRALMRAKVEQHEYVRRKLLETGERELVENSWRDSFWGWGPNQDGQNMLGKLWMELRSELKREDYEHDPKMSNDADNGINGPGRNWTVRWRTPDDKFAFADLTFLEPVPIETVLAWGREQVASYPDKYASVATAYRPAAED